MTLSMDFLAQIEKWNLVLAAATLCIAYLFFLAIYRVTLHPLAGFPGPKLAAITQWYEGFYDIIRPPGGQFSNKVKEMHARYGPIVRINPFEISIQDPDFHETIYAPQPEVRDKIQAIAAVLGTCSGTFGTIDHYVHRKRRAANSNFFSQRNVALTEPLIQRHIEKFCNFLRNHLNETLHMRCWFTALKLDIFFDYGFADALGLLNDPVLARHWDASLAAISSTAPVVKMYPSLISFANRLPIALVEMAMPELGRVLRLNQRIRQQAAKFAANPQSFSFQAEVDKRPETIFQTIHASNLPPMDKEVDRVAQEGAEMFAASGTTARIMWTIMFHLHDRAETLYLLRKEIDEAFPDSNAIPPISVLANLPYLALVIRESLRIGAAVATRLPLVLRKPLVYEKWQIPAYTPVSVNGRDLMHDPSIFPEPDAFKPERWQGTDGDAIPERYFVSFGKGTRMCQGREFEFEIVDTIWERDIKITRDCFLSETVRESDGLKLRVVKERP